MHKTTIEDVLKYLTSVMNWRIEHKNAPLSEYPVKYTKDRFKGNFIGDFIAIQELSQEEVLVLLLALVPYLDTSILVQLVADAKDEGFLFHLEIDRDLRNVYPTGETAQFLLGGTNISNRIGVLQFFKESHLFSIEHILHIHNTDPLEPLMKGRLILYKDTFDRMLNRMDSIPKMSEEFPAHPVKTTLEWKDLVLPTKVLKKIQGIETWVQHNQTLLHEHGMFNRLKPGYRVLFHGPPGTGKTLAAGLLGKQTGQEVLRVDLSLLVSKYIGETEKHLANLFAKAEKRNWMLFFDEADAVFGKRTAVKDSHDRYANQGVSYLLQRIEAFEGVVILASNYKENIDDAFMRRFQSIIEFEFPRPKERLQLWKKNIPMGIKLDEAIDLNEISNRYMLNGSNIINVIQDSSLIAIADTDKIIKKETLIDCIAKEYAKEDRML